MLTIPGGSSLTVMRYRACGAGEDTLGARWLGKCPASCAAFTRRHTAVRHFTRAALHDAGYTTTHEPMLIDSNPHQRNPGFRADLLLFGIDGQPDSYVGCGHYVTYSPTFLEGTQVRCGESAHMRFQQRYRKRDTAAWAQSGVAGLQPHLLPLVTETFGFTHAKQHLR